MLELFQKNLKNYYKAMIVYLFLFTLWSFIGYDLESSFELRQYRGVNYPIFRTLNSLWLGGLIELLNSNRLRCG
jgi:hypothetical protein